MKLTEPVEFDHEERRRIYERVESEGPTPRSALVTGSVHDRRAIGHHVAILKRNGYLRETDDGVLELAIEYEGEAEEFAEDDIEYTIRPARQADLSGIVGAIRQVAERKRYIVAESVADEVDSEGVLLRHNELERRMFFVAVVTGEVVGWVHLNAPELEKLSHTAELTVGVIEGYRGHGIGSHLLARGLEWAGTNGYEKVYNSVPSTNEDAIEFLKGQGWETEAVREDHYKIDGESVDEVMMAVEL